MEGFIVKKFILLLLHLLILCENRAVDTSKTPVPFETAIKDALEKYGKGLDVKQVEQIADTLYLSLISQKLIKSIGDKGYFIGTDTDFGRVMSQVALLYDIDESAVDKIKYYVEMTRKALNKIEEKITTKYDIFLSPLPDLIGLKPSSCGCYPWYGPDDKIIIYSNHFLYCYKNKCILTNKDEPPIPDTRFKNETKKRMLSLEDFWGKDWVLPS